MDETPIWFDMAGNFTINSTGEKTIQICRTGNKKNCFTVVLTVAADGTKFPSICIFKEKRLPHNEQILSGIIVWCQQNGWMDTELMKKYVNYVEHLVINNTSTIMVYNSFRRYLSKESVKAKFCDHYIDLTVIPRGSAGVIALGNPRRVRLSNICGWIKRSWEKIPDEIVIESFKTCRISTSLDRLDDEITDKDSDVGNDNVDGDNYKLITNSNK
uniref:DDE-1 domain-containing protein n=1 Tax=Rhizophagus irregularis (strain DAOM 181602 / DAOM 197198 / MUCL 43194) TaxID=747089 RepID=U9UL62_RHIID